MATTTKYLWDDETDAVVMEKDGSNTTQAVYHSDPVPYGRLFSMRRGGKTYNYRYNAHGDTQALTDESGQTTDTYRYDAWGDQTTSTGTTTNPYRYGGRHGYQFNHSTGDYYIRQRAYQPKQARWESADPLRFVDGLNRYLYGRNSPVNHIDPSGLVVLLCQCRAIVYFPPGRIIPPHVWRKATCVGRNYQKCCREACSDYGWRWSFTGRFCYLNPRGVQKPVGKKTNCKGACTQAGLTRGCWPKKPGRKWKKFEKSCFAKCKGCNPRDKLGCGFCTDTCLIAGKVLCIRASILAKPICIKNMDNLRHKYHAMC